MKHHKGSRSPDKSKGLTSSFKGEEDKKRSLDSPKLTTSNINVAPNKETHNPPGGSGSKNPYRRKGILHGRQEKKKNTRAQTTYYRPTQTEPSPEVSGGEEQQPKFSLKDVDMENLEHNFGSDEVYVRNLELEKELLVKENEKLTSANLSLSLDNESLVKKLDEQLTENNLLRAEIEGTAEDFNQFKTEGHQLPKLNERIGELEERIGELEIQLNLIKRENFQLGLEKESFHNEIETYQQEVDKWMDEKIQLEGDKEDLQHKLTVAQEENNKLKEDGQQIRDEIDEIKEQLEKQFAEMMEERGLGESGGSEHNHMDIMGPQGRVEADKWRQLYEGEKTGNLKLIREKEKLKEALRREQADRIEGSKDMMELEERLKFGEKQMKEAEETRQVMNSQLGSQKQMIHALSKKLSDNEELIQLCTTFLQRNGILATSFLSEEEMF